MLNCVLTCSGRHLHPAFVQSASLKQTSVHCVPSQKALMQSAFEVQLAPSPPGPPADAPQPATMSVSVLVVNDGPRL